MPNIEPDKITPENVAELLRDDAAVKVAGLDVDGMLRGKLMAKKKFLSVVHTGFGFCSVLFGWDMHDQTYRRELGISNKENGYHDIIAKVDLASFRRIPWENDVPFFLVSFFDPDTEESLSACPRSVLKRAVDKLAGANMSAMAGEASVASSGMSQDPPPQAMAFLRDNPPWKLPAMTEGMFGYSISRPTHNKDYYYETFKTCDQFRCPIEGWHTESGPGVFEAALCFTEICEMADRAALFKYTVKSLGTKYGVLPCFMAKPRANLPGNSGHMHISLVSASSPSMNLFVRDSPDPNPPYPDLVYLSDTGRQFLAGVLQALPEIMPLFAPTVNSYKRLVENFWAPVSVSWGLEHRAASVRVITPPSCSPKATRLEIRTPGADTNPYFALAAILAAGYRGIEKKLDIANAEGVPPPLSRGDGMGGEADRGERLAKGLGEATRRFKEGKIARELFGDQFVEHFAGTREHEWRLWEEAVTDWEFQRYVETV
ncbi:glutamine synthetase/guanido kinase [Eremomyces bilateralis CBS 781.70]|uniref:Glutamine synthetase n=1 Tax=Eremomyces bilateralis CBS 781.70 TaxID=1392243 RepID=A0A6G1FTR9_9PEZI|nr:glutamine synthetase/guanido kinase [Eremomyces bilateralis CBS 781.70]KAF1809153.1 glutamine synthetase/guanido kinase [Eremomyces bilateralis CBS 781.70]